MEKHTISSKQTFSGKQTFMLNILNKNTSANSSSHVLTTHKASFAQITLTIRGSIPPPPPPPRNKNTQYLIPCAKGK